jgi:hypothetical protein
MAGSDFDQPATYEITVRGRLPQNWADFFGGFQIAWRANGETVFRGVVVDQSALQGLLNRLYYWGLTLLVVRRLTDDRSNLVLGR